MPVMPNANWRSRCDKDGTILALRGRAYTDQGAYIRTNGPTAARNIAQVLTGPYRIPHVRIDVSLMMTNKTPSGTYRGPGRFEADFFRERLFDIAAADLGLDRVAFRRRNLIAEAEMPYRLATVAPLNIGNGNRQRRLCERRSTRCLEEIDWTAKAAIQGKLIDGRYRGTAIGCYLEGGASGPKESARLVLESDGKVSVYVGSSSIGQGLETVCAQIAADALEIPMHDIKAVFHGSTDHVIEGYGSYSSRSVVMGGNALVHGGGGAARRHSRCRRQAMGLCRKRRVDRRRQGAGTPDGRSLPLGAFAGTSAESSYASNKRTYSYGAHAAHVAVDPKTGRVELLDYVAVEDVGRIINPLTLHGQCVGAIVQGLGGAFLEHFVYDRDGQLLTGSFADYLLPTASDFPNDSRRGARRKALADQSARRQGCGRGRHHPGRRRHRQRGRGGARLARRRAARPAALAAAGVGAHPRGATTLSFRPQPREPCELPNYRRRLQLTSDASSVILVLSSLDTGQPAFALAASSSNFALSAPGILAFKVKCTAVMAKPSATFSSVTSAVVSMRSAVSLASPRIRDNAIVKQPAWAAPISSSGLVPGLPSNRLAKP